MAVELLETGIVEPHPAPMAPRQIQLALRVSF